MRLARCSHSRPRSRRPSWDHSASASVPSRNGQGREAGDAQEAAARELEPVVEGEDRQQGQGPQAVEAGDVGERGRGPGSASRPWPVPRRANRVVPLGRGVVLPAPVEHLGAVAVAENAAGRRLRAGPAAGGPAGGWLRGARWHGAGRCGAGRCRPGRCRAGAVRSGAGPPATHGVGAGPGWCRRGSPAGQLARVGQVLVPPGRRWGIRLTVGRSKCRRLRPSRGSRGSAPAASRLRAGLAAAGGGDGAGRDPPGSSSPDRQLPSCCHRCRRPASGASPRSRAARSRSWRSPPARRCIGRPLRSGGGGWEALSVVPPRVRQSAPRHRSPASILVRRSSNTTHARSRRGASSPQAVHFV